MTHEIIMKDHDKEEEEDKKKKKNVALKSFTQDGDEEDENIGERELEDYALLSKKYKKYVRLKKKNDSKPNFKSNDSTSNKYSMKGRSKKKAMKATWDDSSESEWTRNPKNKFPICA